MQKITEEQMLHFHYDKVTSTNDCAKELLKKGPLVMVTANEQLNGRGRKGRIWYGSAGLNVYLSFGIKHDNPARHNFSYFFQAIGCLTVKNSLHELTQSKNFSIKYPNDIFAKCPDGKYRKISGILTEQVFVGKVCEISITGIGINAGQKSFPAEFAESATSLSLLGYDVVPDVLYPVLKNNFLKLYKIEQDEIFKLWKEELNIEGKIIMSSENDLNLLVERLMPDGTLIARDNITGKKRLIDNLNTIWYDLE